MDDDSPSRQSTVFANVSEVLLLLAKHQTTPYEDIQCLTFCLGNMLRRYERGPGRGRLFIPRLTEMIETAYECSDEAEAAEPSSIQ